MNLLQFSETIPISGDLKIDPLYVGPASRGYDFMLVKLASRATTTPVPMNQGDGPFDNFTNLEAIGFGDIDITSGFETPDRLQDVTVSYINNDDCNRAYRGGITGDMMCAASPGKDSCQNDSVSNCQI